MFHFFFFLLRCYASHPLIHLAMIERYKCKIYISLGHNQYPTLIKKKWRWSYDAICVHYASEIVDFQEENKYEISMDSGAAWKAFYPNQVNDLSHYRSDYGDVWAVCSCMIRLHTSQRRCIVLRMPPMSVMGFCFHVRDAGSTAAPFLLSWTAYSNYLRMINSTNGIKDECFAIRGRCKCLLIGNYFSI